MSLRRREFLAGCCGIAAAAPIAALAQADRNRRLGLFMSFAQTDRDAQGWAKSFLDALAKLGWTEGKNLHIDARWAATPASRMQAARELVGIAPDLIVAGGTPATDALAKAAPPVPVVFTQVADPVEMRIVDSLSRPGGNFTGFSSFNATIGQKWLQLIKEMRPQTAGVLVLIDYTNPSWEVYLKSVKSAVPSHGVTLTEGDAKDETSIRHALGAFAQRSDSAMIVLPSPATTAFQKTIIASASEYRLPAVYPYRYFADGGGLVAYGVDVTDMYARAAEYADLMLRGTKKPADLPVQEPVKYELVINATAARELDIPLSPSLLVRAHAVVN